MASEIVRRAHPRAGLVWAAMVTTGLVIGFGWFMLIGVLRDVLRYRCSWTPAGEGRGWACADGNGYILMALTLGAVLAIAGVVAGFVVRTALRRGGPVVRAVPLLQVVPVAVLGMMFAVADADALQEAPARFWIAVASCAAGAALAVVAAASGPGPGWVVGNTLSAVAFGTCLVCFPLLIAPAVFGAGAAVVALLIPIRTRTAAA